MPSPSRMLPQGRNKTRLGGLSLGTRGLTTSLRLPDHRGSHLRDASRRIGCIYLHYNETLQGSQTTRNNGDSNLGLVGIDKPLWSLVPAAGSPCPLLTPAGRERLNSASGQRDQTRYLPGCQQEPTGPGQSCPLALHCPFCEPNKQ